MNNSITKLLRKRQKIGTISLVTMLLLLFFFLITTAMKYPQDTKALAPTPPQGATCNKTPDVNGIYSCEITGGTASNPFILPPSVPVANSLDNTNLTISGEAYVVSTGFHKFNNVIIKDHVTVTTLSLVFHASVSMDDEPEKQVHWFINKDLHVIDSARINVDYKGYKGASYDGVYPGGGLAPGQNMNVRSSGITQCAGGGGGLGGGGEKGTVISTPLSNVTALGGTIPGGANVDILERGSGGGAINCGETKMDGWPGGGLINIEVEGNIVTGDTNHFSARGMPNYHNISGGAGSGGTVRLKAKHFFSAYEDRYEPSSGPDLTGGSSKNGYAQSGITNVNPSPKFFCIRVSGGKGYGSGGAGGGGIVKVELAESISGECYITPPRSKIPDTCDNQDVTIDGADVLVSGKRNFRKVLLKNDATLSHNGQITLRPNLKHIGLEIEAEELTIEPGSKIDVSGKGYMSQFGYDANISPRGQNGANGGCGSCTSDLVYGLIMGGNAGGNGGTDEDGLGPAGGGSFVGAGGAGVGYRAGGGGAGTGNGPPGVGSYGCIQTHQNMRGSFSTSSELKAALDNYFDNHANSINAMSWGYGGGGGAGGGGLGNKDKRGPLDGGAGGGSISITADTINIYGDIYANGDRPVDYNTPIWDPQITYSAGGAGAGGSISLQANEINITGRLEAKGGDDRWSGYSHCYSGNSISTSGGGAGGGGLITILSANANTISTKNMSVTGGKLSSGVVWKDKDLWGAGTDGLIYIRKISPVTSVHSSPSIQKTLIPIRRDGANPVNNFNPYTLQKGDLIEVKLHITNLPPGSSVVSDEVLKNSDSGLRCEPQDGSWIIEPSPPYLSDNNTIEWGAITPETDGTKDITYQCKVQ